MASLAMDKLELNNGVVKDYTLVLTTRDYRRLGQINGVKAVNSKRNLASADEISFTIYKYDLLKHDENTPISREVYTRIKNDLWKNIIDHKLVWVKELDIYYDIKVSTSDSTDTTKTITGTSLCESELSQIDTDTIEINTETDLKANNFEATTFYNPNNPKLSFLDRVMSNAPHYTIKHVDESLWNLQRTFSMDTTIYDCLMGEAAKEFNCIFLFDSAARGVYVYDLDKFGEDTSVLVDKNNLTNDIQLDPNSDKIKNWFRLSSGDDKIDGAIMHMNPTGSNFLIRMPESQLLDMPEGLRNRYREYQEAVSAASAGHEQLAKEYYDLADDIVYLQSGMLPKIESVNAVPTTDNVDNPKPGILYTYQDDIYLYIGNEFVKQDEDSKLYKSISMTFVSASAEGAKLTVENLSPVGWTTVSALTSLTLIDRAVKKYAAVYVMSGYVDIDVVDSSFTYIGTENVTTTSDDGTKTENTYNYGEWTGKIKLTNTADEEDTFTTNELTLKVWDNYSDYAIQVVEKSVVEEDDDGSLHNVLSIDDINDFKKAIALYSADLLNHFISNLNVAKATAQSVTTSDSKLYTDLYSEYDEKLKACEDEYKVRQDQINDLTTRQSAVLESMSKNNTDLNLKTFFGEYYNTLLSYRREQKYSNENFSSEGLDNADLFLKTKEFIKVASEELLKASEPQYSIVSTLNNLLILPEFRPIVKKFKLGNWIRIKVDGVLYKLRLVGYTINFDDLKTITPEFSTVTKINTVVDDVKKILDTTQSMASTYPVVTKQASQGDTAQNTLTNWYQDGLNSGLIHIVNNTKEEVVQNEYGIICRTYNDITESYDPEQLRLTHNVIAFTTDNWKTINHVIGKHEYKFFDTESKTFKLGMDYGVTAKFLNAGIVSSSQFIGGHIISTNYIPGESGTYFNLLTGDYEVAGGRMVYDATKNEMNLTDVKINWKTTTPPTTEDIDGLDATLNNLDQATQSLTNTVNSCLILDNETGNLILGRELNNALTDNVLIGLIEDENGVYIRNGETVLTSFQEDRICLGNNSEESTIELCGGIGEISVLKDEDGLSEGLYMNSSRLTFESLYEGDGANTSGGVRIDPQIYQELDTPGVNVKLQADYSDGENNVAHAAVNVSACVAGSSISLTTMDHNVLLDFMGLSTSCPIILPNATGIHGQDPEGTPYEMLRMGGNAETPICIVGDGLYTDGVGYTNVVGGTDVYLKAGLSTHGVRYNYTSNSFVPITTGATSLGNATYKWKEVHATNGVIQTSDARKKENIVPLNTSDLFDKLKPVQYNFIEGNKKIQYGFIAQDIITSLNELGIDKELLGLIHVENDAYGLAYTNFIAMLVYEVQKLKEKIATL